MHLRINSVAPNVGTTSDLGWFWAAILKNVHKNGSSIQLFTSKATKAAREAVGKKASKKERAAVFFQICVFCGIL